MSKIMELPVSDIVTIYNDMLEEVGFAQKIVANMNGLWHFCSQCWLVNANNNSVIFQQRSMIKSVAPGLLDVSASGHVELGSNTVDTAIKETAEELGINIDKFELIHAGKRIDLFQNGNILSRIFADVFFVLGYYDIDTCIVNRDEISGIVEIPIQEGLNLFSNKTNKINCKGLKLDEQYNLIPTIFEIGMDMFIKRYDSYYLKVFIASERLVNGSKDVAI